MSVKVYTAYRVKKGVKIWPLLRDLRLRAEKYATEDLRDLYARLVSEWEASPRAWREAQKEAQLPSGEAPSTRHASHYVRVKYRDQLASGMRNMFDFDTAIAVRHTGARYILIPYPGSGLSCCLNFMKRHPALEDYHYQDAADKPNHISAAAWEGRARVWDRLLDDDRFHDKLVLTIVCHERFYDVDPLFVDARNARRRR